MFRVSNRPEVHSNGYHIAFDKGKYGDIGLVIPEWLEERPPNVVLLAFNLFYPGFFILVLTVLPSSTECVCVADHNLLAIRTRLAQGPRSS